MSEINNPQSGDKPVTLWDVDGVLLVQATTVDYYVPPPQYHPYRDNPYLYFSPRHAKLIRPFLNVTDAYYMTAHHERAHADIGVDLGLPELDWVNDISHHGELFTERYDAVDLYFPERAVAWVSDDHFPNYYTWADARTAKGLPTLLIDVDTDYGLQPKHTQVLTGWLGQLGITTF